MATTPNLSLELIAANQNQKHVTANASFRQLDALVQLAVIDRGLTAPPGSPADGDRYLVASSATGAWAGWDLNIAAYQDGAWTRLVPRDGWLCWVADENALIVYDGGAWSSAGSGGIGTDLGDGTYSLLGINGAAADTTNRFAINTAGVLLNHDGAGVNVTLNKDDTTDDASFTFQHDFSTRALFGCLGNVDFTIKVSPDGSSFFDGLFIDKDDGFSKMLALGLGGASPDTTNKLSINTAGALFNHAGAGVNLTLNKNEAANDASFTFQHDFSTRALFGLLGSNDFWVKVSPDGSSFITCLFAEASTGKLTGRKGGVIPAVQMTVLTGDRAGSNVNTAQAIFDSAADTITLEASTTYEFEAEISISRAAGTTSHTTGVLFGGTATLTSIGYMAQVTNPTGNALANVQQIWGSAATLLTLTAANTSATENLNILLKGRIRCNAAGTLIPQFQYSAAPGGAPTIRANSSFKIWPTGSNTLASAGDNWA